MAGVVHRACLADCHGSLSLSPLVPVVTKDSTLNLPRDLLLFSSPFLRTLLPSSACSSPALYLPDCSASDLNHLISLLQNGVSSALPLSNLLVTSRRVESIAAMLGLPLGESLVPLVNNSPSPSVPLAPQLSRDSGISSPNLRVRQDLIEQVKQEKEDNLMEEEVEGDRSTEPRSETEHYHEDEGQDMLDDNIAEDLGDIADTSLNLDDFEDDTAASDAMMSKDNVNEAQEEPFRHICEICEISLQTNEKLFTHLLNDHFYDCHNRSASTQSSSARGDQRDLFDRDLPSTADRDEIENANPDLDEVLLPGVPTDEEDATAEVLEDFEPGLMEQELARLTKLEVVPGTVCFSFFQYNFCFDHKRRTSLYLHPHVNQNYNE